MGHANTPPQLPEVSDEAANSPGWVPVLGVALLVASIATILWCHRGEDGGSHAAEPAVEAQP